jgi:hypothetical protein
MKNMEKKVAAALAAVQLYLQEEDEAALRRRAPAVGARPPAGAGAWAQSGRLEMMNARRAAQWRPFSGTR